ncbi:MAG: thiolase family protein [Ectothiorhodospiraceae bacterium]|nr:thiolase family protein [Ectothiorhodospiraceae bacterium]
MTLRKACIAGVGLTPFGRHEGSTTLSLMGQAAGAALEHAGLERADIDGLITGYSTTHPHLMLSTLFAEYFGLQPAYAHGVQVGGATGLAMVDLARRLVSAGSARRILVVAGENRLTGQTRDQSIRTLAQVGDPDHEVPNGASVPAYYALLASRYLYETGCTERDLAELSVLMRRHAGTYPGAHLTKPIGVDDVMDSKPIATPLKQLDCCPISDGAAAVIVARDNAVPAGVAAVRIAGGGQAHTHQHISMAPDPVAIGATRAVEAALTAAGRRVGDMQLLTIYDSFTVTLAELLEAIGVSRRGESAADARDGRFALDGTLPLNPHGGLLSYGHAGVAGGMSHLVEAVRQLGGRSPCQAAAAPGLALVHADGGVLSSHVSLILESGA